MGTSTGRRPRAGQTAPAGSDGFLGCGTLFKITPSGTLTTLHSFYVTDGAVPYGTLVQDTNGELYGTTQTGGEFGSIFSLSVGLKPFVKTQPTAGAAGAAVNILGTN